MAAVGGLLLALVCIGIVGLAVGLTIACSDRRTKTWLPQLARAAAAAVALSYFLLAAHPLIAQVLP